MSDLFLPVRLQLVLAGMVFFFSGYAAAPWIYHKKIKWLLAFPLWIAEKLETWSEKKINVYWLFLFIFSINSISLTLDLLSGYILFLPILFAAWTGLNIGVVTFHSLKGEFYFAALMNPVALIELPAVFITFALALSYNLQLLGWGGKEFSWKTDTYLHSYLGIVIPLLFIAAIIETAFIHWAQKIQD